MRTLFSSLMLLKPTIVSEELLHAEVQSLNVTDVVQFTSDIINISIPDPPRDFLDFKEVKLYICPAGLSMGNTFYPQGVSFRADVILFGKQANVECRTSTAKVARRLADAVLQ